MLDLKLRLVTMLSILTILVIIGLTLDYLRIMYKPIRIGLWVAVTCIFFGLILTANAVLPSNHFYGKVFAEVITDQKIVALTFDDGPYPPYTNQLLDILREEEVLGTFFLIGTNAERHPEIVQRIVYEGHQIGNHTYSHGDLLKAERKIIDQEITKTNELLTQITGQKIEIIRPPHGFRDGAVMDIIEAMKLKAVGWSVMSRDWTNPGVDIIVNRTMENVRNGSIILLHDGDGIEAEKSRIESIESARHIIRQLKNKGYKFVTVNDILTKLVEEK